jgi:hypothetical protein
MVMRMLWQVMVVADGSDCESSVLCFLCVKGLEVRPLRRRGTVYWDLYFVYGRFLRHGDSDSSVVTILAASPHGLRYGCTREGKFPFVLWATSRSHVVCVFRLKVCVEIFVNTLSERCLCDRISWKADGFSWKDARIRASRLATVIDASAATDDVPDVDATVDSWRQGVARVQDAGWGNFWGLWRETPGDRQWNTNESKAVLGVLVSDVCRTAFLLDWM